MRMRACDKGIQAFEPMDHAEFDELVERPVDLQRRAKAMLPQPIEQRIGLERPVAVHECVEDEGLIAREIGLGHGFRPSVEGRLPWRPVGATG